MNVKNEPEYRLLRKNEVCSLLGNIPIITLERWVQKGVFPKPYKLYGKIVLWRSDDVTKFLENRQHFQPRFRTTKKDWQALTDNIEAEAKSCNIEKLKSEIEELRDLQEWWKDHPQERRGVTYEIKKLEKLIKEIS